ncbi:endonuclease/exonuclease/phosphatase family protein [Photobacterium alginatilyticum]|uniref:endonuclease/exonuclease/phosphatase family protein n=1 Tax=Photobacterium alginatilyticum TaxID=1775171 RepID=UPI0040695747
MQRQLINIALTMILMQPSLVYSDEPDHQVSPFPPLSIVSWNMQWLSTGSNKAIISRTAPDYRQLARIVRALSPDILAFQEVDSVDAIQAILPPAGYKIFLSDRRYSPTEIFPDINQYTGFAIRSTIPVDNPQDLSTLNAGSYIKGKTKHRYRATTGKLRYGSYIVIHKGTDAELHLLNIHLKSGCFTRKSKKASKPCRTLRRQASALAGWVQQRQDNNEHYIVVGDFNHRLNSRHQWLLTALNQALSSPVYNLTEHVDAACLVSYRKRDGSRTKRLYRSLVDHAISSKAIAKAITTNGKVYQHHFTAGEVEKYQLSDHCPLVISFYITG